MKGFVDDIEELTEDNHDFRRVLYTGAHLQLVLMALQPGQEIGEEVHDDGDQFFRIEEGEGTVMIDGVEHAVEDDDAVVVPAGARTSSMRLAKRASEFTFARMNGRSRRRRKMRSTIPSSRSPMR